LLDAATQAKLIAALEQYAAFVKKLGLAPKSVPTANVQPILPRAGYDAYIEGDNIYVKPDHAIPAKVIHEFRQRPNFPAHTSTGYPVILLGDRGRRGKLSHR
jgi:hypothetical protein